MDDERRGGGFRILVVPEDGRGETRSFRIGPGGVRTAVGGAVVAALLVVLMATSWWYLALRAARADDLEERLAELDGRRGEVELLATRLEEVERRYDRLREMFGGAADGSIAGPALPSLGAGPGPAPDRAEGGGAPTAWPLTRSGFVTQSALENEAGHPGLDIAVPSHSYIRAAAGGDVIEVGEDSVYGRFVTLSHGDGYRTRYGHASATLVEQGARVRRNEVIGLTGSTGRSSAPHLHFEILRNGEPVDPLSLVDDR